MVSNYLVGCSIFFGILALVWSADSGFNSLIKLVLAGAVGFSIYSQVAGKNLVIPTIVFAAIAAALFTIWKSRGGWNVTIKTLLFLIAFYGAALAII